jgi:hypothetical protein
LLGVVAGVSEALTNLKRRAHSALASGRDSGARSREPTKKESPMTAVALLNIVLAVLVVAVVLSLLGRAIVAGGRDGL